jgi:hypothetical protein
VRIPSHLPCALVLICQAVQAQIVTNHNDSGPGSLRDALATAAPGTTITFAPALAGQTIRLSGGQLSINKDLVVDASALTGGVILSGDADESGSPTPGDSRVLKIEPGGHVVELRGLTLTGGRAPGAFLNEVGGGIFNDEGHLTLVECTVLNNVAVALPLFSSGGGIYSQTGTLVLERSTISGNTSFFGGGLSQFGGSVHVVNSTISGNTAAGANAGDGGGIYNLSGPLTVRGSTISRNAAEFGGGIFHADTKNPVALDHSIVAGNTAAGANANIRGSFTGSGNVTAGDPLLLDLGDYGGPTSTMPPGPGSPAINAVTGGGLAVDQRGVPRPQGSGTDAGAVEVEDAGYAPMEPDLTFFRFDPETDLVVLRWKGLRPPYVVQTSSDLSFGEAGDVAIPVDPVHGTIDTTTWPGEVQFSFQDPTTTGGAHFWRVAGE